MTKLNALLLAAALAAAPYAYANHDGAMGEHCDMHKKDLFTKADKNGDGSLDKDEARSMQDKRFDEADTNHDGKLSPEEMQNCKHAANPAHERGSMGFRGADKNGDGKLDRKEAAALPNVAKNFDAIDGNKDGLLTRDEVHTFMQNQHKQ